MSHPTFRQQTWAIEKTDGLLLGRHMVCILLIIGAAFSISAVNFRNTYDDAFITYRYAYNLASGDGFVYNVGERFMGTTTPFYGLLLGLLGSINPEAIPLISGIISSLALTLIGLALYAYGTIHKQALSGLLAGLFFVASPLLPFTFGGEMLFQVALVAWALVMYATEHTLVVALLVGLAILTRADSLIVAGVLGLHYLLVRRRLPWRELLVVAAVIAPFILLAWVYYGSPLPGTLGAKLAQRDSGLWPGFSRGLREWLRAFTMQGTSEMFPNLPAAPNAIRYIGFIALGIPALLLFRFWLLPLAWASLFVLGYHLLDVPFYHWYVVPALFGLVILAAAGIAGVVEVIIRTYRRWGRSAFVPWVGRGLSIMAFLILVPGLLAQIMFIRKYAALEPNPAKRIYEKAGLWLASNTPPQASVGYFEIGTMGYYSNRSIIDPLGLVNPGLAPYVANRDFTWAYEHYRPEYIIHNQAIFVEYVGKVLDEPWFREEYREVAQIEQNGYPSLVVFKRTATN